VATTPLADDVGQYVRPVIHALAGYTPGEQPTDPSVIKLNTNENPYPPSAAVRSAIVEACDRLHLYPDPTARRLRERVAQLYGVDANGIVVGNGSDELLSLLMRAVVDPGDRVAYPVPTYSLYDTLVALEGGTAVCSPFPEDDTLPRTLFETPARMLIICNPNSPSGSLTPVAVLDELARARSEAIVVIDEAYVDFASETAVELVGRHPNVVVLRTMSKSYSLAGLRVGFALTTPALAEELVKVKDSYNVSRLAQAGALAALEDQATMLAHVARVRSTRARLTSELERLGFRVRPSEANFVLARRRGEELGPVAAGLKQHGILVRHFASLPDALRISVGTDSEIDRLLVALKTMR
jgi:histidinol-phosphate aminotransferase